MMVLRSNAKNGVEVKRGMKSGMRPGERHTLLRNVKSGQINGLLITTLV